MAEGKLTPKQKLFADEYLMDLNATQAAIRAGYSKKTAAVIAAENLIKPNIAAYIAQAMEQRTKEVKIDANYVLHRLAAIDQMDVIDILEDNGTVKPIRDWPPIWRQFISGMETADMFVGSGDERELVGLLKKVKWPDKIKNLELIGKHVDVQAWKEKVDVDVNGKLTLQEALKQAANDQK